jgi:hypothetical protein
LKTLGSMIAPQEIVTVTGVSSSTASITTPSSPWRSPRTSSFSAASSIASSGSLSVAVAMMNDGKSCSFQPASVSKSVPRVGAEQSGLTPKIPAATNVINR